MEAPQRTHTPLLSTAAARKVPGIYYRAIDQTDRRHLLAQLRAATVAAIEMRTSRKKTWEAMCLAAQRTTFPVEKWSDSLAEQYMTALAYAGSMKPRVARASQRSWKVLLARR